MDLPINARRDLAVFVSGDVVVVGHVDDRASSAAFAYLAVAVCLGGEDETFFEVVKLTSAVVANRSFALVAAGALAVLLASDALAVGVAHKLSAAGGSGCCEFDRRSSVGTLADSARDICFRFVVVVDDDLEVSQSVALSGVAFWLPGSRTTGPGRCWFKAAYVLGAGLNHALVGNIRVGALRNGLACDSAIAPARTTYVTSAGAALATYAVPTAAIDRG